MDLKVRGNYDVIVIGGGHAGLEAARAAARLLDGRGHVALITMDEAGIGRMSCNPAIGGLAKGQIVREIDAMGGLMGRAADASGIMFKMLNTSKGHAVRGPRAQCDKDAYALETQRLIGSVPGVDVLVARVDDLVVSAGRVVGVQLAAPPVRCEIDASMVDEYLGGGRPTSLFVKAARGEKKILHGSQVVLTTGTFLRGVMHTGPARTEGGRVGEGSASALSAVLQRLGFELGRLKTGTPPRLDRRTIDWSSLDAQHGDSPPLPFSDRSPDIMPSGLFPHLPQVECRMTATTPAIHEVIRANLDRAPMFTGDIEGRGPRYCPSIEDKVIRFADRESHLVFLEPEGLATNSVYPNGISTSLPLDVQHEMIRRLPGCERAEILQPGYAVEYDMVPAWQIDATGETKSLPGLFLAGQINGTTGYEEAGGQGLMAGVNAARRVMDQDPVRLGRDEAYIGVMMDDLVTKDPREPYRMFTSRAEHRLRLRADNASERLGGRAHQIGLLDEDHVRHREDAVAKRDRIEQAFDTVRIQGTLLRELAGRPDITVDQLRTHLPSDVCSIALDRAVVAQRYAGYLPRADAEAKRQAELENKPIPEWLDPAQVSGLRNEAVEVLQQFHPRTFGQASRLAGVNPTDLSLVALAVRRGPGDAPVSEGATT
ncbi:MAG: tRNA uridine-5-carboxymethylaminomethyl(34) synthesis enzyme MnmG [Phycisphaerae bacterium]|nr:tRNA uridine-5-carboxymethylaminomethyl(34) synthesis enzyme MnmG [Phycisphaerae bacterium]